MEIDFENKNHSYNFDHVFTQSASQIDVYSEVKYLVQNCIDGNDVCIFAYG